MTNKLLKKVLAKLDVKNASILTESMLYTEKERISIPVPMLNVALSGELDGGLTCGTTLIAGPSKHFKSLFALVLVASYMKKYPDAVVLFFDSEWGLPKHYFESLNIPMEQVIHIPVSTLEALRTQLMRQLETNLERGDHVIIIIDSLSNFASRKEMTDSIEGKDTQDMARLS